MEAMEKTYKTRNGILATGRVKTYGEKVVFEGTGVCPDFARTPFTVRAEGTIASPVLRDGSGGQWRPW